MMLFLLAAAFAAPASAGGRARASGTRRRSPTPATERAADVGGGRPERIRTVPRPISSRDLRTKSLEFFSARGHPLIPSASLVPAGDPTVLFTTAGMHPLVPYLLGEPHPAGPRLAGIQRCVRTGDIDEVGDDTHLTFFEMLGNWSLGDYFRGEAITWSFELLTGERWLALPLDRLGVTCFGGNEHAPRDEEAARIWRALGVQRIAFLADNWWGPAGATGPCGPDTEMFYWVGSDPAPPRLDLSDRRWVEIWNDVFMDRNRTASGALLPLPRPNVDTGMGFERTLTALGGLTSVYEVETVRPLLLRLRSLATAHDERALRIQTDHLRAACFLISDGVEPANKGGGYILRRLLRRAMVLARRLGQPPRWHQDGVAAVQESLGDLYPELDGKLAAAVVAAEASKFERTLGRGLRVLERQRALDGRVAFDL